MRGLVVLILGFAIGLCVIGPAIADVAVKGYYRNNGTYVQPHIRTHPNSTKRDNYSYKNPYARINKPNPYNYSPIYQQGNGFGSATRRYK